MFCFNGFQDSEMGFSNLSMVLYEWLSFLASGFLWNLKQVLDIWMSVQYHFNYAKQTIEILKKTFQAPLKITIGFCSME